MSRFLLVCVLVVLLIVTLVSPCYAGEGQSSRLRHRTLRNVRAKPADHVQPPAPVEQPPVIDPINPTPITQRAPISIHTLEGEVVPLPHEAFGPLLPIQQPIRKEQTETEAPLPVKWKGERHH